MGVRTPTSLPRVAAASMPSGRGGAAPRCVCASPMRPETAPWSYRCAHCRTWASTLQPDIGSPETGVTSPRTTANTASPSCDGKTSPPF